MKINICNDFSETPGARYRYEGDFSGEEFRETQLAPKYNEAYDYDPKEVNETLEFISNDEPSLEAEIRGYILRAKDKKNG